MNNLPKVVAQQRRGRASNPRLLDRKSDALPLSHRATPNESRTGWLNKVRRVYLVVDVVKTSSLILLSHFRCILFPTHLESLEYIRR